MLIMTQTEKAFTKGLEKLEFLTDKTARLLFQLKSEEKLLSDLRNEVKRLESASRDIKVENSALKEKLSNLEKDGVKIDIKVEGLLEAIDGLSPK